MCMIVSVVIRGCMLQFESLVESRRVVVSLLFVNVAATVSRCDTIDVVCPMSVAALISSPC